MIKRTYRNWIVTLGLAFVAAIFPPSVFASMGGVDHLPDYLSVSDFSVNGTTGFQASNGGAGAPSPSLPYKWHPGLTVHVKWTVSDWKHGEGSEHDADVPVDPYTEPGNVYVHFLANGTVRVVVSNYGPRSPSYPGPHDPIPRKQPWYMYPPRIDHRDSKERSVDIDVGRKQCAAATNPDTCTDRAWQASLDEQLVDARRYLPPCASMAGDIQECVRTAEAHMREVRWARRCQTAPNLPECTAIKATPTVR